jgi:hypothetical protein
VSMRRVWGALALCVIAGGPAVPLGALDPETKAGWKANKSLTSKTGVGALVVTKATVKTTPKKPGLVMLVLAGKGDPRPDAGRPPAHANREARFVRSVRHGDIHRPGDGLRLQPQADRGDRQTVCALFSDEAARAGRDDSRPAGRVRDVRAV